MEVKSPIFIIGTGRCGSTFFYEIFSHHPKAAWISRFGNIYPEKLWIQRAALKLCDNPFLSKSIFNYVKPSEAIDIWNPFFRGFNRPFRNLYSDDVTLRVKKDIIKAFNDIITKDRDRILIKITGWSRIGFIKEIFPDAKFIHIVRDGRAVVNSFLKVDFWNGWEGQYKWRWSKLPAQYQKEFEESKKSFLILAAIQWKLLMDETQSDIKKYNPDLFEVKYEDFCSNPISSFENILKFTELDFPEKFKKVINDYNIKNLNDKWEEDLTDKQKEMLQKSLEGHLKLNNYL